MEKQETLRIIDEIIEKANEIKDLQKKIGAHMVDTTQCILVYDESELLEYAEIVGEHIKETGCATSERRRIAFMYKGYEFCTFVTEEEFAQIREKVLPPTKVTEPNQNNE